MAEWSPNGITHYRANTPKHAKQASFVLNRVRCGVCGIAKETTGGKWHRGKSRHDPSVFRCAECLGEKNE